MSTEDIIYILQHNSFLFQQNTLVISFLRTIGWGISRLLIYFASATSSLFDAVFGFLGFTDENGVLGDFIKDFRPVVFAILIVSIFALGIILIVKHEKKPQLLTNILMFVLVVTSCGYVMSLMNDVITAGKSAIVGESSSDVAYETAATDIYDLVYIDSQHGSVNYLLDHGDNEKVAYDTYESFTNNDMDLLDINEILNYNSSKYGLSDDVKSVLKQKLIYFHGLPLSLEEVYAGFGINFDDTANWFNEFYYRYSVDFIPLWISMISLIIIYIVMAYKVFRLIFELGVMRIIALVTSANLSGGQKTVKTLDSIKNSYIVILVCCLLIRFYQMACAAMNDVTPIANNGIIKALCRLFLAFAVIDGPNLIEWLFGIDAGLQSGVGRILAAWHIGKGVGYAAGRAVKKTGRVFGKMFGADMGKGSTDVFNKGSGDDKTSGMDRKSPDPNPTSPTSPDKSGGAASIGADAVMNDTGQTVDYRTTNPDGTNNKDLSGWFEKEKELEESASVLRSGSPSGAESSISAMQPDNNPLSRDAYGNAERADEALSMMDKHTYSENLNGTSGIGKTDVRANPYEGSIFKDRSVGSKLKSPVINKAQGTDTAARKEIRIAKGNENIRKSRFKGTSGYKKIKEKPMELRNFNRGTNKDKPFKTDTSSNISNKGRNRE